MGVLFTLLSAASFGLAGATIRRGMVRLTAMQGLYVTIFVGLPLFAIAALIAGELLDWQEFSPHEYGLLVLAGMTNLGVGRYANYKAVGILGANRSAPIVGMSTLVSVTVAVVTLNEEINMTMGFGILLVMIAPSVANARRITPQPTTHNAPLGSSLTERLSAGNTYIDITRRWYAEGIAFALLAAVVWGVGPVLMRAAVDSNGLSMLAGLVTYASAAAVLLLMLAVPGHARTTLKMNRAGGWWFFFTAVSSFTANMFRFLALAVAPVTLVIPLMRVGIIFNLGFSFLINRSLESFAPRVLAGIFISLIGAVMLTI